MLAAVFIYPTFNTDWGNTISPQQDRRRFPILRIRVPVHKQRLQFKKTA